MNESPFDILRHLQSTGFRDLAGAQISGSVPVSDCLINEVVASSLRQEGPVREVRVHSQPGDAFSVRVVPRAALLPSLTLRIEIDRQPELPASAVLVLRLVTMGGLLGLVGGVLPIAKMLPPGVRLEGDRIVVDLRTVATDRGVADLLAHLKRLRVNTEEGRVVLHVELAIE